MKKWIWTVLLCVCVLIPGSAMGESSKFVFMASTIGPIDSGIVSVLEDQFEKETGIRVRHVGAGTGAALKIAEKGNVDLVMVHAKSLEEKFVKDGFGTERIPLMYNDFVIVGPASDPAGIKGLKTAAEALKTISAKGAPLSAVGTNQEPMWRKWNSGKWRGSSRPALGIKSMKRAPREMCRPFATRISSRRIQ